MRSCSTAFLAEIQAPKVAPIYLVSMQFSSGTIYVWSGIGSVTWNGQTWLGIGNLGGISSIPSTELIQAQSIALTLNGIPSALLADAISGCNQTYAVNVYFGFLNPYGAIIGDPVLVFSGSMDVPTVTISGETASISITCENPLISLNLASNRTFTNDDQFIDYPTDMGFTFVPAIQDWNGNWGTSGGSNPGSSGGSQAVSGGGSGTPVGPQPGSGEVPNYPVP
jgi:hypothetical protein